MYKKSLQTLRKIPTHTVDRWEKSLPTWEITHLHKHTHISFKHTLLVTPKDKHTMWLTQQSEIKMSRVIQKDKAAKAFGSYVTSRCTLTSCVRSGSSLLWLRVTHWCGTADGGPQTWCIRLFQTTTISHEQHPARKLRASDWRVTWAVVWIL